MYSPLELQEARRLAELIDHSVVPELDRFVRKLTDPDIPSLERFAAKRELKIRLRNLQTRLLPHLDLVVIRVCDDQVTRAVLSAHAVSRRAVDALHLAKVDDLHVTPSRSTPSSASSADRAEELERTLV